jgi:hypothetical protein
MPWSAEFDEPIPLPDGGELRTLLDAGRYLAALPRSMHEREEWQMVMEVLLSAVEGREPVEVGTSRPDSGLAGKQTDEGTRAQGRQEIARRQVIRAPRLHGRSKPGSRSHGDLELRAERQ